MPESATIIKALNIVALVVVMLSIGLKVEPAEVLQAARQGRLMALGLFANFVVVPVITVALLLLFQASPEVSAGFLILAVCPGAPMGPSFTAIAKGNVALATGLMVILAGSSAIVAPALLTLFMAWLFPAGEMHFDYLAIATTLLVTQLVPLAVGLGIQRWAPGLCHKAVNPVTRLGNILLIAVIALILATQYPTLAAIRARLVRNVPAVGCLSWHWLVERRTRSRGASGARGDGRSAQRGRGLGDRVGKLCRYACRQRGCRLRLGVDLWHAGLFVRAGQIKPGAKDGGLGLATVPPSGFDFIWQV